MELVANRSLHHGATRWSSLCHSWASSAPDVLSSSRCLSCVPPKRIDPKSTPDRHQVNCGRTQIDAGSTTHRLRVCPGSAGSTPDRPHADPRSAQVDPGRTPNPLRIGPTPQIWPGFGQVWPMLAGMPPTPNMSRRRPILAPDSGQTSLPGFVWPGFARSIKCGHVGSNAYSCWRLTIGNVSEEPAPRYSCRPPEIPSWPQVGPKSAPRRSQVGPKSIPHRPQIDRGSTPKHSRVGPDRPQVDP